MTNGLSRLNGCGKPRHLLHIGNSQLHYHLMKATVYLDQPIADGAIFDPLYDAERHGAGDAKGHLIIATAGEEQHLAGDRIEGNELLALYLLLGAGECTASPPPGLLI